MASEPRFLLYSHDGLGLGHTRRNLAIAGALIELAPGASVLLATGADEVGLLGVSPNVEFLKLPGLRKTANGRYAARHLNIPEAHITELRSALLKAAAQSFRPDVMLVDRHPLGAKGELGPALGALWATGGRAVLGLRDILDNRGTVLSEWEHLETLVDEYYDRVLVYGHRNVLDPIDEYDFPASVADRTRFCGYVLEKSNPYGRTTDGLPSFAVKPRTRPVVLATAGGGEDGFTPLQTFIGAAAGAPWDGIVVAGSQAPEEQQLRLRRLAAGAGVTFHTSVPRLAGWFGLVDALVCMGGYNTIAEAVSRGTPTVCVPRTSPRSEQLIRARSFARLGLLRLVEPDQLDTDRLQREVAVALRSSRQKLIGRANAVLDFDGARQAAGHLLELAEPSQTGAPVRAEAVAR